MPHTKSGRAFTALVLEVFRFNGRLLTAGDRLAKPLNLTSARWQVLGAIEQRPLSVAQIARNMGLARQSVQRLADDLERESFIRFEQNPDHKRAKLACLTNKGHSVLKQIWQRQTAWANQVSAAASSDEIETALAVLHRLRSRLMMTDRQRSPAAGGDE